MAKKPSSSSSSSDSSEQGHLRLRSEFEDDEDIANAFPEWNSLIPPPPLALWDIKVTKSYSSGNVILRTSGCGSSKKKEVNAHLWNIKQMDVEVFHSILKRYNGPTGARMVTPGFVGVMPDQIEIFIMHDADEKIVNDIIVRVDDAATPEDPELHAEKYGYHF